MIALLAALTSLLALPGAALAGATNKVVSYDRIRLTVPAGWPVFHLSADSTTCVRFDRHAVYLGEPGGRQLCPQRAAGRTEAILVSPGGNAALTPVSSSGASRGDGSMLRLSEPAHHATVTATWGRHPQTIARALGLSSLHGAVRAADAAPVGPVHSQLTAFRTEVATTPTAPAAPPAAPTTPAAPATPGEVYDGLGFDACSAPSANTLSAWTASPYRAVGVYIGGTNMACSQSNLTSSWVSAESAAGWHLVPIYVGLQAPGNSCGCAALSPSQAANEGTAAAEDAVTQAQTLGLGSGNPIYYDMESYTRTPTVTAAVLQFLQAWTAQLHASGYLSGVYSSGSTGIADLVAATAVGYPEPDDIWVADWNGQETTVDPYVPDGFWVNGQRLHQFQGGHTETYGGVSINIDGDFLDGATAAAGSGTPPTSVTAPGGPAAPATGTTTPVTSAIATSPAVAASLLANGTTAVTPSWTGGQGVSSFRILAGNSRSTLATIATVSATHKLPVSVDAVYSYFQAQALNAAGSVLASSPTATTPSGVAIFGNSAFVTSNGALGVPVTCVNASPCKVTGALYDGKKRMTHTGTETIARHGGLLRFSLTKHEYRVVATARKQPLPVTVDLSTSTGAKASRTLKLHTYTISGRTPTRTTASNASLRIVGKTDFVSNGWVGGVLVACTATTACQTGLRVTTPGGAVLATASTQTLGSGRLGYLAFRMTPKGHKLLHAAKGNQLAARVSVSSTAPSSSGGAAAVSGAAITARASLDSFS